MHYLHRIGRPPARTSGHVLPSARSVIVARRRSTTRDRPYSTETARSARRRRSRATPGATTTTSSSRRGCDALARRGCARAAGDVVRGARLRRHRARAGARLCAVRRARLDRQEHLPDQPRARLVGLPVRDHLQPARSSRTRPRSISAAPARCASTRARPARSSSPACSTRRAASRISRSRSRARFRRNSATSIGEHAYGCDICQDVCPWNLAPRTGESDDPAWQPRAGPRSARRCSTCGADRTTSCARC